MLIKLEVIRTESEPIIGPQWDLGYTADSSRRRLRLLAAKIAREKTLEATLLIASGKNQVRTVVLAAFSPN